MKLSTLLRVGLTLATFVAPAAAQTGPTTIYVPTQPETSGGAPGASLSLQALPAPILAPTQPSISLPPSSAPRNQAPSVDDVMTLGQPPATNPQAPAGQASSRDSVVQRPVNPNPAQIQTPVESQVGRTFRGIPQVLDGNTIRIDGILVVLHGADAPELGQTCFDAGSISWNCGDKASRHLAGLVGQKNLTCTGMEDIPGGVAATCVSGNTDFAKAMVRDGMAVVPDYLSPLHSAEQAEARSSARGIWVGGFVKPEVYRSEL